MQYAITLPSDYDMTIIRRRIADRGHLLDHLPGLGLKAYLVRERAEGSSVNQYAPFYLWTQQAAMGAFLWEGGGFQGIVADFGRPAVQQWTGAAFALGRARDEQPRTATLTRDRLPADSDPRDALAGARAALLGRAQLDGVHSTALAVDPAQWEIATFTLWADLPPSPREEASTTFQVLHLSSPHIADLATVA